MATATGSTTIVEAKPTSTGLFAVVRSLVSLTKPTIMLLVVFTGATGLVVEGSLVRSPLDFVLFLVGLFLTGGCANALNQYFERRIDACMSRTSGRRALPQNRVTPIQALVFAISIGVAGLALLAWQFNWLTAALSLGTILFYSLFYTLYLKPRTAQNIVIGGAAGAMAPVGAWAAATGGISPLAWLMFLIIFLWTPPHFWALAIAYKDDYRRTSLPMMPVVRGDRSTLRQIFAYTLLTVAASLAVPFFGPGWLYTAAALVLGGRFIQMAWRTLKQGDRRSVKLLFGYSILYLFGLFLALIVDALI